MESLRVLALGARCFRSLTECVLSGGVCERVTRRHAEAGDAGVGRAKSDEAASSDAAEWAMCVDLIGREPVFEEREDWQGCAEALRVLRAAEYPCGWLTSRLPEPRPSGRPARPPRVHPRGVSRPATGGGRELQAVLGVRRGLLASGLAGVRCGMSGGHQACGHQLWG